MKISSIYSNKKEIFPRIDFNIGNEDSALNVILANIENPKDISKSSHNLGKTTLVYLLNFMLLSKANNELFLIKNFNRFKNFTFYLEIFLTENKLITIKRSVASANSVSIKKHRTRLQDFSNSEDWDHKEINYENAMDILNSYFNFKVIKGWSYRMGISYFLRSQADYSDVLQISKFMQGKHSYWKPFVAKMCGLDDRPIKEKYNIDDAIENKNKERLDKKAGVPSSYILSEISKYQNDISILKSEIDHMSAKLDSFDFKEQEMSINKELVNKVEKEISFINDKLFNINTDISRLKNSVSNGIKFNIKEIKKIFEEASILMPEAIVKSYEELTLFNKKLSQERNATINGQIETLEKDKIELEKKFEELNSRRINYLEILRNRDVFDKYKKLQNNLSNRRAELKTLETVVLKLLEISELDKEIIKLQSKRSEKIGEITNKILKQPKIYKEIQSNFNKYVKKVLNRHGSFYVDVNSNGNIDFHPEITFLDSKEIKTSQDSGTTFKKLLCVLFDLSVLKTYENDNFYHFVYHDGIFENLEPRKRRLLFEVIQDVIKNGKTQYIFSSLASDLPFDNNEQTIKFSDNEIVLNLNDSGYQGLLFKMPPF